MTQAAGLLGTLPGPFRDREGDDVEDAALILSQMYYALRRRGISDATAGCLAVEYWRAMREPIPTGGVTRTVIDAE